MNTRARIEDAAALWRAGRREGAMLLALAATTAMSRLRYPREIEPSDRKAFETFVRASLAEPLSVEHRGVVHSAEGMLYRWLRSELAHDSGLPVDLAVTTGSTPQELTIRSGRTPDSVVLLSSGWFQHLVGTAMAAPEVRSPGTSWVNRISTSTRAMDRT